jgi:Ras-related protein Rab-2A
LFRRQVTYEEGENLAKTHGLMFLETSAKSSYNVEESFNISSQTILKNIENNKTPIEEKVYYYNKFNLFFREE